MLEVRRHRADWPPTQLALSVIVEDHGVELAAQVVRQLVVFLRRRTSAFGAKADLVNSMVGAESTGTVFA